MLNRNNDHSNHAPQTYFCAAFQFQNVSHLPKQQTIYWLWITSQRYLYYLVYQSVSRSLLDFLRLCLCEGERERERCLPECLCRLGDRLRDR